MWKTHQNWIGSGARVYRMCVSRWLEFKLFCWICNWIYLLLSLARWLWEFMVVVVVDVTWLFLMLFHYISYEQNEHIFNQPNIINTSNFWLAKMLFTCASTTYKKSTQINNSTHKPQDSRLSAAAAAAAVAVAAAMCRSTCLFVCESFKKISCVLSGWSWMMRYH